MALTNKMRRFMRGFRLTNDDTASMVDASGAVAVRAIDVPYTDAQIKARCWAIDAVPAPGAGMLLTLDKVVLDITIVTPYTNINATLGRLYTCYDSPDDEFETGFTSIDNRDGGNVFSALFGSAGRNTVTLTPASTLTSGGGTKRPIPDIWQATTDLVNKNLGLIISNPTNGDLTGGGAGNSMIARFYYDVMEVAA